MRDMKQSLPAAAVAGESVARRILHAAASELVEAARAVIDKWRPNNVSYQMIILGALPADKTGGETDETAALSFSASG
jgi:hypothetical protein